MKKLISLLLILVISISLGLTACTDKETVDADAEPVSFKATDVVLVENFKSNYQIVIPSKATQMEEYAAQELQYFMNESTGCMLEIVKDNNIDSSKKYLSVGNTSLLSQTQIDIDLSVMGETGPSIDTIDGNVYMAGAASAGILNSVYKFLEYQINFEAFAYDCVTYDFYNKLYLLDFDYHYVPNLEYFTTGEFELRDKKAEASRLNVAGGGSGGNVLFDGALFSGAWCHTIGIMVPQSTYPWAYNNAQLCFTDTEVFDLFSELFFTNYAMNASGPYIMIGGNDNPNVCECSGCTESYGRYGVGGTMSIFINKVADYTEKRFAELGIQKNLCIVGLYYLGYESIPTIANDDGTYSPIDPLVVPDNEGQVTCGMCYAPMHACYIHPFGDQCCEKNSVYTSAFRSMSVLTDNIFAYIYGASFGNAYRPGFFFDNYATFAENYKFFNECGVRFVTEETDAVSIRPLSSLNIYLRSRFAWDETTDYKTSVNDFMSAYYGLAAEYMNEYLTSILEHFEATYTRRNKYDLSIYDAPSQEDWPHQTLLNFATILENAMYTIEKSGLSDEDKAVYLERVKREWYIVKTQELFMYADSVELSYLAELERIVSEGEQLYTLRGNRT